MGGGGDVAQQLDYLVCKVTWRVILAQSLTRYPTITHFDPLAWPMHSHVYTPLVLQPESPPYSKYQVSPAGKSE